MVERLIVGPWKTNCYIYSSSKKECIIIDPGGDEAEIASRVDVLNMVPAGIALTHGHIDQVAALGKLRASYASRGYSLSIAINSADRKFLGLGGLEMHRESLELLGMDEASFFGQESPELPKADVKLTEGDRVFGMDLLVLETPGHTPGSVCFYSEKEGILFSGDTIFFDGMGRTDLPGGSEKKLRESIQKKLAVLPPETRVFAGHGPFTSIEREKRGNPFLREKPPQESRPEPRKAAAKQRKGPQGALKKTARPAKPLKSGTAGRRKVARPSKPVQAGKSARPAKPARIAGAASRARPSKPAARSLAKKSTVIKGSRLGKASRSTKVSKMGRKSNR